MMTFGESVRTCLSKYVTFSGRAQRSEFWWWILLVFSISIILAAVDSFLFGTTVRTEYGFEASTNTPIFSGIFGLVTLLPTISVAVRRLHDLDKSGWWYWIALIPLIGGIILIVWFAMEGTRGANRYGPDPLGGSGGGAGGEGLTASSVPNVPRD